MGRVIAIGPGGKPQAPERSDLFRPVIDYVRDAGGLDMMWLSPPCRNMEQADRVRRGLCLSARYYCSCGMVSCVRRYKNYPTEERPEAGCPHGGQRISCRADVVKDGQGKLRVQFALHDKQEAMREVVRKYGPDPEKWPYLAKRKRLKEA